MKRAIAFLVLFLGGGVLAQESASFKLKEHVFNAGGHPQGGVILTSASFRVSLDARGEGIAAAPLTSSSFVLDGGFCTDYPPAGEAYWLAFQDATTLGWNPAASVGTYNLYRDLLGNLPGLAYGICEQEDLGTETISDADTPPIGEGYFYLVTAENRLTEEGTKGMRDTAHDDLGGAGDPGRGAHHKTDGIPGNPVINDGRVALSNPPLNEVKLTILSASYIDDGCGTCDVGGTDTCVAGTPNAGAACTADVDCGVGDCDPFPDTSETGTVTLNIRNDGVSLTGVTITLQSSDPGVACITVPSIVVPGGIASGATAMVTGFTFTASSSLQTPAPPGAPENVDFQIGVIANETIGTAEAITFNLMADVNVHPGVTQVFTKGPDGLAGTADDGITLENFDIDKDGNGVMNAGDTFRQPVAPGVYKGYCSNSPLTECDADTDCRSGLGTCGGGDTCTAPASKAGQPCTKDQDCDDLLALCYLGMYISGTDTTPTYNTVAAVTCGGFYDAAQEPACQLDPDFHNDWHFHCPVGATNCPNTDSNQGRGCGAGGGSGELPCSYDTPDDGEAHHYVSSPNSMHVGAHYRLDNARLGDTTHFRTLQGYQAAPVNLALFPRSGDLEMSMWHIARLMDNNHFGCAGGDEYQCVDCADVQIRIDGNNDPEIDDWGFWDKLVPFQNVYDKKVMAWSGCDPYYCEFTPTDTGTDPPNPRGIHETMCYPFGAWSHCGSTIGTTPSDTVDCPGPGMVDPADGTGVWVETKFNLAGFLGQRVQIRWIISTWVWDRFSSSYYEVGGGWDTTTGDDGWWLDDITIRGTVEEQVTPLPDTTPRSAPCPFVEGGCVASVCTGGSRQGESCSVDEDCTLGCWCGVGACEVTVDHCVDGVPQTCTPGVPLPESCDGLDNDCNGATDEGLGQTTCGIGACEVTVDNCFGGVPQSCIPGDPTTETCNGLDNDCDGAVDEDDLGNPLTRPTTCGVGACTGNTGIETCSGGAFGGDTCDPLSGATPEACNGIDDDCDGTIDGFITSTCGVGECAATGMCIGGVEYPCTPGTPSPEVCDGVDNDCDGVLPPEEVDVDGDGFPFCAECDDGDPDIYPGAPEINDGVDNQCDGDPGYGMIDEISSPIGFWDPLDDTELSWPPPQAGCSHYQVARSPSADSYTDSACFSTGGVSIQDPALPDVGDVHYYVAQSLAPFLGSAGRASNDVERTVTCSSEPSCVVPADCITGGCCSGICRDLTSDPSNCGFCGCVCSNPHGTTTCTGGICDPTCDPLYGDCDGNPTDGCETPLNTLANCGACGAVCNLPGATESCSTGTCTLTGCLNGYSNCDGNPLNGCEVNHHTDANSCSTAFNLGNFRGDDYCGSSCSPASWEPFSEPLSDRRGRWLRGAALEFSPCEGALQVQISLEVPPGVDYDLMVYDSCGGALLASSQNGTGVDELVTISKSKTPSLDTFPFWIWIRHVSGSSCDSWGLRIRGRASCP